MLEIQKLSEQDGWQYSVEVNEQGAEYGDEIVHFDLSFLN